MFSMFGKTEVGTAVLLETARHLTQALSVYTGNPVLLKHIETKIIDARRGPGDRETRKVEYRAWVVGLDPERGDAEQVRGELELFRMHAKQLWMPSADTHDLEVVGSLGRPRLTLSCEGAGDVVVWDKNLAEPCARIGTTHQDRRFMTLQTHFGERLQAGS